MDKTAKPRLHALDAFRGVLAAIVAFNHIFQLFGLQLQLLLLKCCVFAFFIMSAYVLARSWDGDYGRFLLRRAVRLYPVFFVCVLPIAWLLGERLTIADMALAPWRLGDGEVLGFLAPPAWSLSVELTFTPLLPALFWLARRPAAMLAVLGLLLITAIAWPWSVTQWAAPWWSLSWAAYAFCFALGAFLGRWAFATSECLPVALLWLGRVSYSLYLVHWPVMAAVLYLVGNDRLIGGAITTAVVLPIAWLVWRCVEVPSIRLSRAVGRKTHSQMKMPENRSQPCGLV